MNTKALKQKILDLAIHGKLLPLDKVEKIRNDEPASILLEKIRAEKEEKIAKGELKKDKKDSFIFLGDDKRHYEKFADGSVKDIEDEIPFDIPDGWSWCRLVEITSELGDGIHGTPEYDPNGDYFFVNGNNLCNGKIIIKEDTKRVSITEFNKYKKNLNEKTVFVSINGTLGNVAFYNNESIILGKSACYLNLFKQKLKLYIFALLNSEYFKKYSYENATGSTIKNVSLKSMRDFLIPLPPLSEQQLIVSEIEKIFAQIDLLEQNKTDLQTAIKQAKSKILNLAIHGKLVSQDPNDEPASILLEKIRAEKQEKIAKGELKKDKKDSFIFLGDDKRHYEKFADGSVKDIEDEIPFDIPDGWSWCRLPNLCSIPITDGTHNSPPTSSNGDFLYITAKNIKFNGIDLSNSSYVSREIHEKIYKRCPVEKNDVLLTKDGTIGEVTVNNLDCQFSLLSSVALIKPVSYALSWYITYVLKSDYLQNEMKKNAKGSALKRIILEQINSFFIPLPPLSEQQLIVSEIEEIFAILDRISSELGADI